ncbi:DNA-directed RNA polymerase subunit E'' [archaeon CG_4_10_14_0_2_um_filter_Archaea_38_6]|nr:MAG: DNA-directed RNA polymerase subunit E'' [archaeon CG07_land_8_20_14_0_80_38_8]PIU89247.1 MAG: DNA-directed RNA polymerase subunit E'' [archaeon CG06_land_8_20_14_3_00_37_11]PJA22107.1 MAG: DNA-directed RNA polymerase subunit E'' [archaeon CG_4_10_14_0_2_um_filter_Archaea_38_6]
MNEYACKKCNRILTKKNCPTCQNVDASRNWKGLVVIFNSEKSEVAKKLKIGSAGMFALRVR